MTTACHGEEGEQGDEREERSEAALVTDPAGGKTCGDDCARLGGEDERCPEGRRDPAATRPFEER